MNSDAKIQKMQKEMMFSTITGACQSMGQNYKERGIAFYQDLATQCGINPQDALSNLTSMLSSRWDDDEHFLMCLGQDDELAIIEARQHFNLPPFE